MGVPVETPLGAFIQGGKLALNVTFYGVRGSTPCAHESVTRYGGNTSCVALEVAGQDPIVLDLGTGLRYLGLKLGNGLFRGTALVTHLHWDHVQGLPFFSPLLRPGSHMEFYAPPQEEGSLLDAVHGFMKSPYFPVGLDQLPGTVGFVEATPGTFQIGQARVRSAWCPHVGPTLGYRIDWGGASVAYLSDHQQPGIGSREVARQVLELVDGVDLLIHDAQFDEHEFAEKWFFGHCTTDYALEVAAQAGAKRLALFHHDPLHTDGHVDSLLRTTAAAGERRGPVEVIAAGEGLTLQLGSEEPAPARSRLHLPGAEVPQRMVPVV